VPCVVQDWRTGEVLTVAYMNADALARTRETGEMHFFSRSRQELWHKGETSGNTQALRAIRYDCDADTLLALVEPAGPACHTGERTCFFRGELEQFLLLAREQKISPLAPKGSYAGAIGIPQFMPGSVRRYAVDFDGDGAIDLRRSAPDAIGSVANFLKEHGWRRGAEVLLQAQVSGEQYRQYLDGGFTPKYGVGELTKAGVEIPGLPAELHEERGVLVELETPGATSDFRVGLQNFYVLTRYNRSAYYATVVADLAKALRENQEPGK